MKKYLLVLLLLSGNCLAADQFGAIAYSTATSANGWAKDHASRQAAERAAVKGCSQHARDCKAVLWFKNGCGALAISAKAYGWGWGTTQKLADAEAIKACSKHAKNCKVTQQVCTTGAS